MNTKERVSVYSENHVHWRAQAIGWALKKEYSFPRQINIERHIFLCLRLKASLKGEEWIQWAMLSQYHITPLGICVNSDGIRRIICLPKYEFRFYCLYELFEGSVCEYILPTML